MSSFVSPTQINGQLPFQIDGNARDRPAYSRRGQRCLAFTILPAAPSVFLSGTAGPLTNIPTIVRGANGELVTVSNPVHPNDQLTVYLTGMGNTAPSHPRRKRRAFQPYLDPLLPVTVTLGGMPLTV